MGQILRCRRSKILSSMRESLKDRFGIGGILSCPVLRVHGRRLRRCWYPSERVALDGPALAMATGG